ncbi:hypothetical protein BGW80DRAFT_1267325 [Lactifluus volemus]|nr:hypothetical protein BGW80DRAFT_1267325 [Lactifluus volemus]
MSQPLSMVPPMILTQSWASHPRTHCVTSRVIIPTVQQTRPLIHSFTHPLFTLPMPI